MSLGLFMLLLPAGAFVLACIGMIGGDLSSADVPWEDDDA